LGNWQGNTVFAYPDVAVNISGPAKEVVPGEDAFYNISFENKGYDVAQSAVVRLELPKGTIYVSDSSGSVPSISGSSYTWNLGNIAVKTTGSFKVKVKIDSSLRPSDLLSFWQKIIPQAHAAEDDQKGNLVVRVNVSTIDPQSNTGNDSSQTTTTVSFPQENSNQDETYGIPVLEITAKNNVGEFVYPGDTVTFGLVLKNTGTGTAKNVVVTQTMHDGSIDSMGSAEFTVGDLLPGKSAKINFGLTLTNDLAADIYTTEAVAQGQDQNGNEIGSNEGRTQFEVKGPTSGLVVTQTLAATGVDGTSDGQVLGGKSTIMPIRKEEWMIYLLALLLVTFVLIEILKSKK
ncbi:MAG: hypothetical protein Q8O72_00355, partial [Bacteroidales bacterium]|nr:hypothetical protein [Bacteroidales bacterium]